MNSLIKILIVEHDPTDLELLQRELKRGELRYVSEVVQNEQDYLNALSNFMPDIILSDYSLPSFDGLTAFKLREKIVPHTPFIFVSGTIGEENSIELIKSGVTDYALKDKLFTLNIKIIRALKEAKAKRQKIRTDEELKKSEAFNRGVLNSLSSHIAVIDRLGTIVAVNESWKKFALDNGETTLDRTAEGSNYFEVCDKAARAGEIAAAETKKGMIEVLDNKRSIFYLEYPCHSPEKERWFALRVMSFESDEPMIVATHQDITERKLAEMKLEESHDKLKKLTDKVSLAIYQFEITAEGAMSFPFISKGIEQLLPGVTAEQVLNDASVPFASVYPEDFQSMMASIEVSRQKLVDWNVEYRNVTPKGEVRWFKGSSLPEKKENGTVVWYGYLEDVTEKKRAENQIKELNESLEDRVQSRTTELVEANTALEAFSYSVSHDLKAPVRTLMGFTKLIHNDYGHTLEPELKELFDHIESSSRRMNAIIEDLLKLAKYGKEKLHESEVNMTKLFSKVWDNIRFSSSHNAVIEIRELPDVRGDSSMLEQVIVNLLSNAVKYSSKKEEPQIEVGYEETNDGFAFYVKDNGAGFDMKDYDRLFGAFHRLHGMSEFEGTGIGLTLVKRIVEKHEGKVWAEAKVGEGATFYFTLPVKD